MLQYNFEDRLLDRIKAGKLKLTNAKQESKRGNDSLTVTFVDQDNGLKLLCRLNGCVALREDGSVYGDTEVPPLADATLNEGIVYSTYQSGTIPPIKVCKRVMMTCANGEVVILIGERA